LADVILLADEYRKGWANQIYQEAGVVTIG
jgi:hypothetical protein